MTRTTLWAALGLMVILGAQPQPLDAEPAQSEIHFPRHPAINADGSMIAFASRGDLWTVGRDGGECTRITHHLGDDSRPQFSPDGSQIAFVSNRTGAEQVWVVPTRGGAARQITQHSEGTRVYGWHPDGSALLIRGRRDHHWYETDRIFLKPLALDALEEVLFDAPAWTARLSPDGSKVAYMRDGVSWTRKRYEGASAYSTWVYDRESKVHTRIESSDESDKRAPQNRRSDVFPHWSPDGESLVFLSEASGVFNLVRQDLKTGTRTPLTAFEEDGPPQAAVSMDGSTAVVWRHFRLERVDLAGEAPHQVTPLKLFHTGPPIVETTTTVTQTRATDVAFTDDGREIATIVAGDLYVMDTELREPIRITLTPAHESDPVFTPDHTQLYFTSSAGGQTDIWRASRKDDKKPWWLQTEFKVERITNDAPVESELRITPDGSRLSFVQGRKAVVTLDLKDTSKRVEILRGWDEPSYSFSPDGHWIAYAQDDNDFNSDVWIKRADGTGEPVNVSRHPDWDGDPAWSPDGKILAFVGQRWSEEADIAYVFLKKADGEETARARKLKKALDKMKGRKKPKKAAPKKAPPKSAPSDAPKTANPTAAKSPEATKKPLSPWVGIWKGTLNGEPPIPDDGFPYTLNVTMSEDAFAATISIPGQFDGSLDSFTVQGDDVTFQGKTPMGPLTGKGTRDDATLEGTWTIEGVMEGTFSMTRTPRKEDAAKSETPKAAEPNGKPKEPAEAADKTKDAKDSKKAEDKKKEPMAIDFDGIADRIQRIRFENVNEGSLIWGPKGKRLAFEGKDGTYSVEFPDKLSPKRLSTSKGKHARWLVEGKSIAWLVGGQPATTTSSGKTTSYSFRTHFERDAHATSVVAFDEAWTLMRDYYYDESMGGNDWNAIRSKYRPLAQHAATPSELSDLINLMLGELNGSHLGYSDTRSTWRKSGWKPTTGHLGVRFDRADGGEGLLISYVVPDSPATRSDSRLEVGERILPINGNSVSRTTNLVPLLTGDIRRALRLRVLGKDGEVRTLSLHPTTYAQVRGLLYDAWRSDAAAKVAEATDGKLGYLHIRGMNWSSFQRFEAELYKIGHGKDGLIIDVRENGGGFTTDHLLTCLTQPVHAFTIPRGGGVGYPRDAWCMRAGANRSLFCAIRTASATQKSFRTPFSTWAVAR